MLYPKNKNSTAEQLAASSSEANYGQNGSEVSSAQLTHGLANENSNQGTSWCQLRWWKLDRGQPNSSRALTFGHSWNALDWIQETRARLHPLFSSSLAIQFSKLPTAKFAIYHKHIIALSEKGLSSSKCLEGEKLSRLFY